MFRSGASALSDSVVHIAPLALNRPVTQFPAEHQAVGLAARMLLQEPCMNHFVRLLRPVLRAPAQKSCRFPTKFCVPRIAASAAFDEKLNNKGIPMNITLSLAPLVSLVAGILILVMPRLLNYIVAIYLIVIGLIGLFGAGNLRL
jgi:hypothetical protein